jgi:hypothetical protein
LYQHNDIPISLRAVLMMTFDRAYVLEKDHKRAAKDIRAFMEHYPNGVSEGKSYHWASIASFYEGKPNCPAFYEGKPNCPAVGLWCTTVSRNPFASTWKETEDGTDEIEIPFDWSTAFDIYYLLDSI